MIEQLVQLSRTSKRALALAVDTGTVLCVFLWCSLNFIPSHVVIESLLLSLIAATAFVGSNVVLGLYSAILRYAQIEVVYGVAKSAALSSLIVLTASAVFSIYLPVSVVVVFALMLFASAVSTRLLFLSWVRSETHGKGSAVVIYGAGSTGRQLIASLNETLKYNCVAFVDDAPALWGLKVEGVKVYPPSQLKQLVAQKSIKKVLLAIPSASGTERRAVLKSLEALPLEVLTVPSLQDIVSGSASTAELKEVSIADLLGRKAVPAKDDLLSKDIYQKAVMVTGAGGSIGSELCRQAIMQRPNSLVLFEQSEYALYRIHQELIPLAEQFDVELTAALGSVQDYERLTTVIKRFKIQSMYHAAAYKHVPLVEHNVIEGVRNNVMGTYMAIRAAQACDVSRFVLISTDKAVRPTNVMGASKRFAELVVQAFSEQYGPKLTCSMVRFGNVLGSSGSVVPKFREQIQAGGPITLTHREITRYFMTIPEASQLVIQAGAMARGGEVFVLDMGQPVKIFDLAVRMIRFSGLEPALEGPESGDIEIAVTGLRPGEKLYEELLIEDNAEGTLHPKIMSADETKLTFSELTTELNILKNALELSDVDMVYNQLLSLPLGFSPSSLLCDLSKESSVEDSLAKVVPFAAGVPSDKAI